MSCCQSCINTKGTNDFFSSQSKRYLKEFQKKGLGKEQRFLVEGITSAGITNKTILDIGCGIGGAHLTLLQMGAASATGIDISEGMIAGAKQLAQDLGYGRNTSYFVGDIVQMNDEIQDADIVMLDKVVCCYENIVELLEASGKRAKQLYAFTYPNPNLLVKISFKGLIWIGTLFKWKFRPSWHNWDSLIEKLETFGFKQTYNKSTLMWNICVLSR